MEQALWKSKEFHNGYDDNGISIASWLNKLSEDYTVASTQLTPGRPGVTIVLVELYGIEVPDAN